jgi:hypothetical protein
MYGETRRNWPEPQAREARLAGLFASAGSPQIRIALFNGPE